MMRRILAVVAAVLLVGAVALALTAPPEQSLADMLAGLNPGLPGQLHGFFAAVGLVSVADPLLAHPAWLIPACLGVIVAGVALTKAGGSRARRLH